MGHQIGKDGISLKSKMNVLKSMVPSVNVMTSRLQVYPRMRLLVTQSTEDNYETNFLKIGLL